MPKTQWQEEIHHLTPAQMILFFGNNAGSGHNHQELDADGSCPKITIADMVSDYLTGTINVDVISTYFTTPVNADWTYYKIGSVIFILITVMAGMHATNAELQFTPNAGSWPAPMVPSVSQYIGGVKLSKQAVGSTEARLGGLFISSVAANNIIALINDDTAELKSNGFGTGGVGANPKGIWRQTISYIVD